ncbi:Serine-threonine/tyrosine-protein kinase, catalytic domain [Sesbania bispinosa]|nr:Serine-threonine/tyrosine-protein kinase, catalytic domain [Sesbania bispinosa]
MAMMAMVMGLEGCGPWINLGCSSPYGTRNGNCLLHTPNSNHATLVDPHPNGDTQTEMVFFGGKLKDGREVAVKHLFEHNYRRVEQFINEIEVLSRLRHRNLVSLYGCTSRHTNSAGGTIWISPLRKWVSIICSVTCL